jgi:hypothetical protein
VGRWLRGRPNREGSKWGREYEGGDGEVFEGAEGDENPVVGFELVLNPLVSDLVALNGISNLPRIYVFLKR